MPESNSAEIMALSSSVAAVLCSLKLAVQVVQSALQQTTTVSADAVVQDSASGLNVHSKADSCA